MYGTNIRLLLQSIKSTQSHRPEEAIPDSYDNYEPGLKLIYDVIYSRIRNEINQTKNISQRSWQSSPNFYTDILLYYSYTRVKFE